MAKRKVSEDPIYIAQHVVNYWQSLTEGSGRSRLERYDQWIKEKQDQLNRMQSERDRLAADVEIAAERLEAAQAKLNGLMEQAKQSELDPKIKRLLKLRRELAKVQQEINLEISDEDREVLARSQSLPTLG